MPRRQRCRHGLRPRQLTGEARGANRGRVPSATGSAEAHLDGEFGSRGRSAMTNRPSTHPAHSDVFVLHAGVPIMPVPSDQSPPSPHVRGHVVSYGTSPPREGPVRSRPARAFCLAPRRDIMSTLLQRDPSCGRICRTTLAHSASMCCDDSAKWLRSRRTDRSPQPSCHLDDRVDIAPGEHEVGHEAHRRSVRRARYDGDAIARALFHSDGQAVLHHQ